MIRWAGLCICLFLSLRILAIEAVVTYAVFYIPETGGKDKPYVELSWQINPATIHFAQTADSQWQATIKTHIVFSNEQGPVREDNFLLQTPPKPSYQAAAGQSIIDLHRYTLPEGKIKMTITLAETIFEDNKFTYTDSFIIEPVADKPYYSSLQLLDTAYVANAESIFQKNGRLQIPLAGDFLDDHRNILHLYTELYQAHNVDSAQFPLVQRIYISRKPYDAVILQLQNTDTVKPAPVLPFLGQFNIAALPSGNYYLNAVLENRHSEIVAKQSLFFQRSNKTPVSVAKDTIPDTGMERVNILDLGNTFIGKYSLAQVRAILKMMLPIALPAESRLINNFLDKPEDTYMRYFIYNFWKARDEKAPEKPWEEYTKRVKEVNKLFGYGSRPGYETERGVIYLKYGKPTERIVVANEPGSLPYEVWQYNALDKQGGGGVLLFYNPQNMINDFRLLHSTVNDEGRNTAWRNQLYFGGSNPNSRAEQYFRNR